MAAVTPAPTRADAEALDAADPIARFRDEFEIAGDAPIYMDGNSLGRPPRRTRARLQAVIEQWRTELVGGWHEWIDAPVRAGDAVAEVVGAREGEVVVADSVTVNLYKLVQAALAADLGNNGGQVLVTDRANFPTDRYVLEGIAEQHGWDVRLFDADPVAGPSASDVAAAIDGAAVLVLSHVNYRSGAIADMTAITAVARAGGIPVIWDLSHSAGAVPVQLAACGADLAVGCTYKYLNAGPGAPGFVYVRRELQEALRSPIWGWFGQREQFAMERGYDPQPDIRRFLAGTPPILGVAAVEEGARLIGEAGIWLVRQKYLKQTQLLLDLADARLAPLGFTVGSPRDETRGSHVSLRHPEAWPLTRALIDRAAVVPDFRGPDTIRYASAPLYTRFVDVWDAVERLAELAERGDYERGLRPGGVT